MYVHSYQFIVNNKQCLKQVVEEAVVDLRLVRETGLVLGMFFLF